MAILVSLLSRLANAKRITQKEPLNFFLEPKNDQNFDFFCIKYEKTVLQKNHFINRTNHCRHPRPRPRPRPRCASAPRWFRRHL